jgi:hypothetical protein
MKEYHNTTYYHHLRTLYVMRNQLMHTKVKQDTYLHSIGTICIGACLAQGKY